MATQIKITQLTDIGSANLATTTLLPVVNMAGVPTTQKTTLGNLANVILSQSGGNFAAVARANIAYSVANAAQPNITSVGTLTSVSVSGNATVGNLNATNLNVSGQLDIGDLSFEGTNISTPILNGNIYINGNGPNGHVEITANSFNWTFDPNGNMTLSDGTTLGPIDGNSALGFDLASNMQFQIMTNNGSANYSWYFNKNGSMIVPTTANSEATIQSYANSGNNGSFIRFVTDASSNLIMGTSSNNHVVINVDRKGANLRWMYDDLGDFTVPGNILVSGSASPAPYISGFDSATFATNIITTPGNYSMLTAVAGGRAFINDGNLVAAGNFGTQVSGGGSNIVPVWSDGTNWYIG